MTSAGDDASSTSPLFPGVKPGLLIFGVSFLSLFLELLVIRYLAIEIRFFTFFKNFALMSAFLGLGIGFGLSRWKRDLLPFFIPAVALLIHVALFASELQLNRPFLPTGENVFFFWLPTTSVGVGALFGYGGALFLVLLTVFSFAPLGQLLGRLFSRIRSQNAYAWDLAGSAAGVIGYMLSSFLELPPQNVAVALLGCSLVLVAKRRRSLIAATVITLVLAAEVTFVNPTASPSDMAQPAEGPEVSAYTWSPYYRLHLESYPRGKTSDGKSLSVGSRGFMNGYYYFDLLDFRLSEEPGAVIQRLKDGPLVPMSIALRHYSLPYALLGKVAAAVLILGGGPGNDASVALINGAKAVTVVEIDPEVVKLGKDVHPLRPYLDSRVTVDINDARAHIAQDTRQYDIVSFGHLDSIMLLSSFSSIRLDSYVYTEESIRRAFSLVKPGGLLSMSFASQRFVTDKIYDLLGRATGLTPLRVIDSYMGTITFLVPKGWPDPAAFMQRWEEVRSPGMKRFVPSGGHKLDPIPTDDWPFLFLKEKRLSPYHAGALAGLLLLTWLLVRRTFLAKRGARLDWHLFWLGGGFFLVEVKSITELSLLFGSTWMVNAIAILGVLAVNLVAIAWIERGPRLSPAVLYACLGITIGVNLFFPLDLLLNLPFGARLLAALAIVYSPLFFAGAIFTRSFRERGDAAAAFGSNLLGAIAGGCLEYLSVLWGFKLLWILAFGLYAASAIAMWRGTVRSSVPLAA
jgi:hypothetical protein